MFTGDGPFESLSITEELGPICYLCMSLLADVVNSWNAKDSGYGTRDFRKRKGYPKV